MILRQIPPLDRSVATLIYSFRLCVSCINARSLIYAFIFSGVPFRNTFYPILLHAFLISPVPAIDLYAVILRMIILAISG